MQDHIESFLNHWLLPLIPEWVTPNHITMARIIGAPIAAAFCVLGWWPMAAALVPFLIVSDFVDGWLARVRNQSTEWGRRADEVGDKLMLVSFFAAFVAIGTLPVSLDSVLLWAFGLTLLREVVITVARHYAWVRSPGVLQSAKLKTALQMIAIAVLILAQPGDVFYVIGVAIFVAATICAFLSAWWYWYGTTGYV